MVIEQHRERVIEQLQLGFAGDHYEVGELERRISLAQAAESSAALDALVTDLAATTMVAATQIRVVLGSAERRGPWELPRHLSARVSLGNLVLDLREARIAAGVSEIEVHVTMGTIEIVLPPDVTVDFCASVFLGAVEDRSEPVAGSRVVRVVGRVKLGNLEISTLQRGETKREGRWRRRYERRARRHVMRHRLLPRPYEW